MPTHVFQPGPGKVKSTEMLGADPDGASPFEGSPYKLGKNDLKGGTLNLSRFLLRFDLTGFVKNETVSAATLDLNVVSAATAPSPPDPAPIAAMYMLDPADRDWNVGVDGQSEAGWFFKDKITTPPEILWSTRRTVPPPSAKTTTAAPGTTPPPK